MSLKSAVMLSAGAPALVTGPCAFARDRPNASVVEARLTAVEDITGRPGAPCFCDENGKVLFDGSFRLTFAPLRTWAGPEVQRPLSYEQASAMPFTGRKFLVVVSHEAEGDVIVWKGPSAEGLCLEPDEIKRYGLERAAREHRCHDR